MIHRLGSFSLDGDGYKEEMGGKLLGSPSRPEEVAANGSRIDLSGTG